MACCKGGCRYSGSASYKVMSQQQQEKVALNILNKKKQKELLDKKIAEKRKNGV